MPRASRPFAALSLTWNTCTQGHMTGGEIPPKKTVDSWMSEVSLELRSIAEALRQLVLRADPALTEAIKWGNPVYEKVGKVCLLVAGRAYVSLGFFNGASLTDPEGLIEGTGKKMRHIKVRNLEDIWSDRFTSWIREAIDLDRSESS